MKNIFIFTLLLIFMGFSQNVYAEEEKTENSFRYSNGIPLCQSEDNSETITLFSSDDTLTGIDVSTHQGIIDWDKVKAYGIDFAIIRCGYGDNLTEYDDKQWKRNADECTRLGIPFGAYLYSHAASIEEAHSEAAHALRLLDGYELSYPVYLDLEDESVEVCSNELIGEIADVFCSSLQNAGYETGIYATLNWWNTRLTSDVFDNPTWHKWIAHWSSACGYTGEYTMWQYTDSGYVDGISGNVDMNYWYGDTTIEPTDYSYPNTYINTGNVRKDIVEVAKTQIGYTELTGNNGTPVIDSQTPYYTKYGAAYGNPTGHWCSFFVLWCAKQAGIPTSVLCQSPACGSCGTFVNWFRSNHRWKEASYTPQSGDIIFFDWESDGSADHVGIVLDVSDNIIYTIEGNTGGENGYTVMQRDRNSSIFGYGVPDYELMDKINGYGNQEHPAYMLPDSTSSTVWEIWQNDELQVLCRDGDYYLVLYPFEYSGKFIAAYVPVSTVDLKAEVPDSGDFYSICADGTVSSDTIVYHNPTTDTVSGSIGDKTIRATLNKGDSVKVLFSDNDFLFIRTDTLTGYVPKDYVTLNDAGDISGDVNGDGKSDAGDAGMILRYDVRLIDLSEEQIKAGDVNGDEKTDAGDAGIILRRDAGLI